MPAVTTTDLEGDPHAILARLRASAPVARVPALGGWLVTRRDLAVRVLRSPDVFTVDDPRFSTARVVGPSMLSLDGAAHTRHRLPFEEPFGLRASRDRFTDVAVAATDRLVARIAPAGAAELRRAVAGPLSVAVVTEALGLPDVDAGTVLTWYDAIVDSVAGVAAGRDLTIAGTEAFGRLQEHVAAAIRRRHPSLLTTASRGDGGLSVDEVTSNAAVLMFGGIETTEGMIANLLWFLLRDPVQLALVRAEPALLANAIEESLRMEPAAAVVDRYATRDTDLGGAPVRRGDLVTVSITGANRDPAVFADPDVFDIRRAEARRHLAFAGGPHVCIGMHVARIETRIAVGTLLDRLPGLRLDPDRSSPPRGLVFRKPPALHAVWS